MPGERRCSALPQLCQKSPVDETAAARVELVRWADGSSCPSFGSGSIQLSERHDRMTRRYRSSSRRLKVRSWAVLEPMRLAVPAWVISISLSEVWNCPTSEC